jgi:hypothetical protein
MDSIREECPAVSDAKRNGDKLKKEMTIVEKSLFTPPGVSVHIAKVPSSVENIQLERP